MTVPIAQTRAGTSSTQPRSQLAPSDFLCIGNVCGENLQPADRLLPVQGVVTYQGHQGDEGMTCCQWARVRAHGPQQPTLLLSRGKTTLNCVLTMAAAIPAGHAEWSCKLHLEPAALLPWYEPCCGSPISMPASVRQSGLSRARKAVEGCWGTLNYPGVATDWVSDRKVISATFTSLNAPEKP